MLDSWGRFSLFNKINQISVIDLLPSSMAAEESKNAEQSICFGNGRSYGDSALSEHLIHTVNHNLMLEFNDATGVLKCQSGVLLSDILDVFVNRGWFLSVTPGTKFVTLGGAISSDVHGKNQQTVGSFCDYVLSLKLLLPKGEVLNCSLEENTELFKAVCGGMGLMGIILEASIQLKKIPSSFITQVNVITDNLEQTLSALDDTNGQYKDYSYTVAWIDCLGEPLKRNSLKKDSLKKDSLESDSLESDSLENLGRGVVSYGEHKHNASYEWKNKKTLSIPKLFPSFLVNRLTGKLFNQIYYYLNTKKPHHSTVSMEQYFYPLDGLSHWNRLYGRKGFLQYQFVVPKEHGLVCLTKVLSSISSYKNGAYLAVLKNFGPGNNNYLSFPMPGYTLAVDFKIHDELFPFLEALDDIVLEYKGRFYLAKDSRINQKNFEQGYPDIERFRKLRIDYGTHKLFQSYQSKRLGL